MVSPAFENALLEIYRGEQFGEGFFEALPEQADVPNQAYVLGSLLQLETEGKAIVRPLLSKLGLPLNTDATSKENGIAAARSMRNLSWRDRFSAMAAGIRASGLPRYEALSNMLSPDDEDDVVQLAKFVAQHERAVLSVAEALAAEDPDALAALREILVFPLIEPADA